MWNPSLREPSLKSSTLKLATPLTAFSTHDSIALCSPRHSIPASCRKNPQSRRRCVERTPRAIPHSTTSRKICKWWKRSCNSQPNSAPCNSTFSPFWLDHLSFQQRFQSLPFEALTHSFSACQPALASSAKKTTIEVCILLFLPLLPYFSSPAAIPTKSPTAKLSHLRDQMAICLGMFPSKAKAVDLSAEFWNDDSFHASSTPA